MSLGGEGDFVGLEHSFDGERMALRPPETLGMLIDDVEIVLGVEATEEDDGVVGKAVVHRREPLHRPPIVEAIDDMDVVAEGMKELAGGDVPFAVVPGFFLPTGAA